MFKSIILLHFSKLKFLSRPINCMIVLYIELYIVCMIKAML